MFLYNHRTHKRGFTLTELAIVMGVMGAVLGSIWLAAAKVNSNNKAKKAAEQVLIISQNYRPLFKNGPSGQAAWTLINAVGIANGAFPDDMIVGGNLQNPWGGPVNVYDHSFLPWSGIIIEYGGLSQRNCNLAANAIIDPVSQQWATITRGLGAAAVVSWVGQSASVPNPIGPAALPSVSAIAMPACQNAADNAVRVMFPVF
jgi:prepilin-type N-terminal cleavage/methylation domain-containing protein